MQALVAVVPKYLHGYLARVGLNVRAISPVKTYSKLLADVDDRPYKTWPVLIAQALVKLCQNACAVYRHPQQGSV